MKFFANFFQFKHNQTRSIYDRLAKIYNLSLNRQNMVSGHQSSKRRIHQRDISSTNGRAYVFESEAYNDSNVIGFNTSEMVH